MTELISWLSVLMAVWALTAAGAIGLGRIGAVRARRAACLPIPATLDAEFQAADENFECRRTAPAAEPVDVTAAVHRALHGLVRDAARLRVRVQVALREDLMVHADPRALHRALTDIMRTELRLSSGAAILVTGRRHGGQIEITCLADGPAGSEADVRVALRDAAAIFALHGASMEIDRRAAAVVVRVRMAEFAELTSQPAAAPPAGGAVPARRVRSRENEASLLI